jgi:hypothetical protein
MALEKAGKEIYAQVSPAVYRALKAEWAKANPTQALLQQIAQNAARHMFAFSHAVKDKA